MYGVCTCISISINMTTWKANYIQGNVTRTLAPRSHPSYPVIYLVVRNPCNTGCWPSPSRVAPFQTHQGGSSSQMYLSELSL